MQCITLFGRIDDALLLGSPMRRIASIILCCLLAISLPASACSTFATQGTHGFIVGRNMDNALPVAGLVLINKRGLAKSALPWATLAPNRTTTGSMRWVSKYGSVTMTAIGRDFPDGGMNEAGLVVEEMTLSQTVFPAASRGFAMSQTQWIQYQLDSFTTVREVLEHLDAVPQSGWGWHFLIADASGECVSLEFIEGQAVTGRDARISGCVLTNDTFSASREYLSQFEGFGGKNSVPASRDSLARFVRAAAGLSRAARTAAAEDVDMGFELLSSIDQGENTQRSIVYEVTARRFHFRTHNNPGVKFIDLNRVDFSPTTPTLMLDIETSDAGDVTTALVPHTTEANRRIVESFVQLVHLTGGAADLLKEDLAKAGLSEEQFVKLIAHHPEASIPPE